MKFCKIVLIVLLALKCIRQVIITCNKGEELKLEDIFYDLVAFAIMWGLYYGAGILDV
jgi:hypothetical protein